MASVRLVTLRLLVLFVASQAIVIHINPQTGNDTLSCIEGEDSRSGDSSDSSKSTIPCHSLKFVAQMLYNTSNITIIIDSPWLFLTNLIAFADSVNVRIEGRTEDGPTNISCVCEQFRITDLNQTYPLSASDLIASHGPLCHEDCASGFHFHNVSGVFISNINVFGCGSLATLNHHYFMSALQLHKCSSVHLTNITFSLSINNALFMVNVAGKVSIISSKFINVNSTLNPLNSSIPGGLFIVFNYINTAISYDIESCVFENNNVSGTHFYPTLSPNLNDYVGLGVGGGMGIIFNYSSHVDIILKSCLFCENRGHWGAGLAVQLQEGTWNNSVRIINTSFIRNNASRGGGGVNLRFGKVHPINIPQNRISFERVNFENNKAKFGGGTWILSRVSPNETKPGELIKFTYCQWNNNYGSYSPAVHISRFQYDQMKSGFFVIAVFEHCNFSDNTNAYSEEGPSHFINSGVFVVLHSTVKFEGNVMFTRNKFSALALISGMAVFEKDSNVVFYNNTGFYGGAILLHGFSALSLNANSTFNFTENKALMSGGAIYYITIDPLDYFQSRFCFLLYTGEGIPVCDRNLFVYFDSNKAKHGASDIFMSTLSGCFYYYLEDEEHQNMTSFFYSIGNFSFSDTSAFGTYGKQFIDNGSPQFVIPGMKTEFNLTLLDEVGKEIETNFAVLIDDSSIHSKNGFTEGNSTELFGAPHESGTLKFSQESIVRNIHHSVNITLTECPPGYYFDQMAGSCKCSANDPKHVYSAIHYCNSELFQALIQRANWVGYYPQNSTKSNNLYTSFCPFQFCRTSRVLNSYNLMPNSSNELEAFVCESHRSGLLCGACESGYSVLYHSSQFRCFNETEAKCHLGLFYYVLSEIIPVTLLFVVIIIFDISFTSGSVNCLIFFSQVLNGVTIDFNYYKEESKPFNYTSLLILQNGYRLIYGVLSMDFFNIEQLSFCLWKTPNIMCILAFRYVTTIYAFILIIILIILMNYSKCSRLFTRFNTNSSVTNGLSAFLIICYAQSAQVAFFILTKATLTGNLNSSPRYIDVTYYGGLPYFKGEHLYFAVPAVIVLITLVTLPPLYLTIFPLLLYVLTFCGLSEHPAVTVTLNLLQVNRLKPLTDSFQASYKDRMRPFAGLYFLYRVALLSTYSAYQGKLFPFLEISVAQLGVFLGIHAIAQPYTSRLHNVVDGLLLFNLVVITELTLFCLQSQTEIGKTGRTHVDMAIKFGSIQLILVYLPIIVLCSTFLYKFIRHVLKRNKCSFRSVDDHNNEEECDPLLGQDSEHAYSELPTY